MAEALKAGVRPLSRDTIALCSAVAAWVALAAVLPAFWVAWKSALRSAIGAAGHVSLDAATASSVDAATASSVDAAKALLLTFAPVMLGILLASLLGWTLQGALRFRSRASSSRVVAQSTARLGTLWLCAKALVIGAALMSVTHHALRAMVATPTADLAYAQRVLSAMSDLLASRLGVVLGLMAIADLIVQRQLWRRSLRMTRDELKRELRETEGDPTLRAERRGRQRQTALEP